MSQTKQNRSTSQRDAASSPIAGILSQVRGAVTVLLLVGLCVNVLQLTSAMYMLQVYDRVLASQSEATLLAITLLALILVGVYALLEACRAMALIGLGAVIDRAVTPDVFNSLFRVATLQGGGKMSAQPLRDLEQVRTFITTSGLLTALDIPWIPVFVFVLYLLHPIYAVFGVAAVVLVFTITAIQAVLSTRRLRDASNTNVQAYAFIEASLRNAEVSEAMGMRSGIWERWQRRHSAMLQQQRIASQVAGTMSSLIKFLQMALTGILILGVGAVLVIEQQTTPGVMIVASMILARALAPTMQIAGLWQQLTSARAAHRRLCDFLANAPHDNERMPLPAPRGELSVEGLVMGVPGRGAPILRGVSFSLAAGELLAVIGPSAAGKSTLARGVLGIWPPLSGTSRLDEADLSLMPREQIGRHVGYLPQDVELFEGTISENIARLGKVDPEAVVRAASTAGLHDMILHLPDGYDTQLGPGGSGISPGQRQRIGLARSLYGTPRLIVLDEPNSNLDSEGEAALARALLYLREQKVTCVVITHRASVLATVDKILVLRAGQVEAFGRREEILPKLTRPARPAQPAAVVNF
jgi:ATP-binding cassette, subfamily C, bacterial EexD